MRRVLVLQLARFGDLVQTKRLLLSLAEDAEVHLALDRSLEGLARILYPFAQTHPLPAHLGAGDGANVFTDVLAAFSRLKALHFDTVYILNYSPLAFACAALFEPEQVRGYARVRGQEMGGLWPGLIKRMVRDRRFSSFNLADVWAFFHPAPLAPEKVNPIPRPAESHKMGLVMAGRESRRSLPPKVLAECLKAMFKARGGPELVCIGSRAESSLVRRLLRELPRPMLDKVTDMTGKTTLTDLPDLLGSLDLLVTPDTGAMHLAAHCGTPVQAFFLSSAWAWETGPYGFGHTVWQALVPCAPCLESAPCPHDLACLPAFSHPSFLAHLSGAIPDPWPEPWPNALLGCVSMLDDAGVTLRVVDGGDPYMDARAQLRAGLIEWLGARSAWHRAAIHHELADYLFEEQDWMLPPAWPGGDKGARI